MSERFSEDDVVMSVTRLTRTQLVQFINTELVKPQRDGGRYVFQRIDIARLELLCDLSLDLDLDETALGVVISLIDQLHAARDDLAKIASALDALPPEVRSSIAGALKHP